MGDTPRPRWPRISLLLAAPVLAVLAWTCADAPDHASDRTPDAARPDADAPGTGDARRAPGPVDDDYDPVVVARASVGKTANREAVIPSQCYTATAGVSNPCYTCHTTSAFPNAMDDWGLQLEYAFSEQGTTNHWSNLFIDRSGAIAATSDTEILAYVREDNYSALGPALQRIPDYPGYVPDFDIHQGVDSRGFALDGSAWRAFRYKPFLGTFFPTNGSTDDVFIRLPPPFRQDTQGRDSVEIHAINLAILEASMASDPAVAPAALRWPTEPLDETIAGLDLDGDGQLRPGARQLAGLPSHYVGKAQDIPVARSLYPEGTELLHSVRYIDPDAPTLIARRMKELRYARKVLFLDRWAILAAYADEHQAKDEGLLPRFAGSPMVGLRNDFGWQLQGFIEDADGRLRLQTEEEHIYCMGCHSTVGVTLDQTFAFPRKLPGAAGWGHQDVRGIPDVPQLGHDQPEILAYFQRVGGGDEFRANTEILERFFPGGVLDTAKVRRAAPGGDRDIGYLIAPTRDRALALDKAYRALVREQRFDLGRDTVIRPPTHVHRRIDNGATGLESAGLVFPDGRLRLDWSAVQSP